MNPPTVAPERARHDWDYTEHAEAYLARPGYPDELVERLRARAAIDPVRSTIVEIGAGTGKMTVSLAAGHAAPYVAVEPCRAMRELGAQETAHLDVRWVAATGEQTGLDDACADYVMLAQCFDTMDRPAALDEIARILRPGGHLTVLWNHRVWDESELDAAIETLIDETLGGYERGARRSDQTSLLRGHAALDDVSCDEASHRVTMSAARYVDVWRSVRTLRVQAGARFETLVGRIGALLDARGATSVDVTYRTRSWTARRR